MSVILHIVVTMLYYEYLPMLFEAFEEFENFKFLTVISKEGVPYELRIMRVSKSSWTDTRVLKKKTFFHAFVPQKMFLS